MNCDKCRAENGDGAAVCKNCEESMKTEAVNGAQPVRKRGKRGLILGITAAVIVAAVAVIFVTVVLPSVSNASLECGNTPMNIQNGGIAAESGGWIYYCNSSDGYSLYKIRTDGTGKTKLNSDSAICINVTGGWVYYLNFAEGRFICRVRTDGTDGEIIKEKNANVFQLYVYGDWIYYEEPQGDHYLYKMLTDGTEKTGFDIKATVLNITDGWIYYLDNSNSKSYKMRLDGTNKTELGEGAAVTYLTLTDGWIYYNDGVHLSKMREDGTDLKKLSDDYALGINVADGWVYYANVNDGECIYKVRTDGTERIKLNDHSSECINIAGDWIYYSLKSNTNSHFYRMKTDGSENQPVD